ncbi:MAG: hypothetical protein V3V67_14560, partial [Myxococcota bacterium]
MELTEKPLRLACELQLGQERQELAQHRAHLPAREIGAQTEVLAVAAEREVRVRVAADLLGWGIGAAYALRLIRDAPERFAAAVLIEPAGRDGTASRHDVYTHFQDTLRLARAEGLEAVVDAARRNPRFDDNPAAGPYGQRLHDDPLFAKDVLEKGRER